MSSSLPRGIRRAFSIALQRPRIDDDVDAEVAFHLAMRTAELVARGKTPEDARAEAIRRFGDTHQWSAAMSTVDRERMAQERRAEWMDDLRQDLRFALRSSLRAPLFTAVAIITLALGIGANAAVFGVVKSVLLDALPYADADRLVRAYGRFEDGNDRGPLSAGTIADIAERQRSFERVAAFAGLPRVGVFNGSEGPRAVEIAWVEPALFRTLGVSAAVGRMLTDEDAGADTAFNVLVSHAAWRQIFGGDPEIVGRTVRVNGIGRLVVGVLPERFVGPVSGDFFFPLSLKDASRDPIGYRRSHWLGMVGRLEPGASFDVARRELEVIATDLAREYPKDNAGISVLAVPMRDSLVGDTRTPLLVLMASAALVLLITCANLAGALLSRTLSRRKEFAVRVALGAGRGRLVRQLLTESTVLALAGGATGVALAMLGLRVLRGLALPALPGYAELRLDGGALLVTAALALVTGFAFGLAPALSVSRANVQGTLRDETRGTSESVRSRRLRGVLVAAQIALCISLLAGAGLLARSLWAMATSPLGFNADRVLTVAVQLPFGTYGTAEARAHFRDQLEERLRALPGVTSVGSTSELPTKVMNRNGFSIEGAPPPADDAQPFALFTAVSVDYFRALSIPLRRGRVFSRTDRVDTPLVMVISESMARRYYPGRDPIGSRMRMGPDVNSPMYTVIGVVGDVRNDPARADAEPAMYASSGQFPWHDPYFVIRARNDPSSLIKPAQRELAALDPGLPMHKTVTLRALLADGLSARRLPVVLMSAFGALALFLASVGVYAMFASMAAAREREFGVRVALGSSRQAIAGLVLRQGALWMAVGIAAGAFGVVLVVRSLRDLLYGVEPFDPLTLGLALATLLTCGILALLLPVRRATRVDPITVLR